MAVDVENLKIVTYPAPVLRGKAKSVPAVTDEVRRVALRMLQLMHEAPGIGLAAPQVGLPWRLFVANPTGEPADDRVYINPVLSQPSRKLEDYEEGCLSLPGINGHIRRPIGITIEALDLQGQPVCRSAEGLEARVWQHETDHLDGVLILDRMPPMDRMASQNALRELEAKGR
jgi:peptide deformylase